MGMDVVARQQEAVVSWVDETGSRGNCRREVFLPEAAQYGRTVASIWKSKDVAGRVGQAPHVLARLLYFLECVRKGQLREIGVRDRVGEDIDQAAGAKGCDVAFGQESDFHALGVDHRSADKSG